MKKKWIAAILAVTAAMSVSMTAFAVSVEYTTDTWKAANDLACLGSYTIGFTQAFSDAGPTRQVVYMDKKDNLDVWVSDYSYPASGTVYTLELVAVPLGEEISFIDDYSGKNGEYGHYAGEIEMPLAEAAIANGLLTEEDFDLSYEEELAKLETLAAPLLDQLNGSYPVYQIASDKMTSENLGRPEDYLYFLGMINSDADGYTLISDTLFRFSDTGAAQTDAQVPAAPMKGDWASDNKGWWIQYPDGTYMVNDWYQSPASGLWYYMGADGYMLTDTVTPDGFYVNAEGVWVQ